MLLCVITMASSLAPAASHWACIGTNRQGTVQGTVTWNLSKNLEFDRKGIGIIQKKNPLVDRDLPSQATWNRLVVQKQSRRVRWINLAVGCRQRCSQHDSTKNRVRHGEHVRLHGGKLGGSQF